VLFQEGVQHGDPLRPLLFSLTVAGVLNACDCDFVAGYLDDFTLGGSVLSLIAQVRAIESTAGSLGLSLNYSKCEIIGLPDLAQPLWQSSLPGIHEVPVSAASLLSSRLCEEGVQRVLDERMADLARFTYRLSFLSSHESLFLLRSCLSLPKLLYLMRSSPCFGTQASSLFDESLRSALVTVSNCAISDDA